VARVAKELEPVDRHAAEIVASAAQERGLSQRRLEELTGISQKRVGKILRAESPAMTLGEMHAMASAVGMAGGEVLRWAIERAAADQAAEAKAAEDARLVTLDGEEVDPEDYTLAAMDRDADEEIEARQQEP
jgi:transcriptional regulator with XRE-family HTH domain